MCVWAMEVVVVMMTVMVVMVAARVVKLKCLCDFNAIVFV
jgi:hypothetical protein